MAKSKLTPAPDAAQLIASIRPGDGVKISTPQGQTRRGRAVMPCSAGGWVLNMGGRYGTPGIADTSNVVAVYPSKRNHGG